MPECGRTLYASLIGINEYDGNVKPLKGCVKDVLLVDAFLRDFCDQQHPPIEYKPLFLLSPKENSKEVEIYQKSLGTPLNHRSPTFQNVSHSAFSHLEQADNSRKDICLFYFSGHGAITSDVPIGFGTKKLETLVCKDSRYGARDLRDKEIAFLLHKVLDTKPNIHCLVITDCCHAGGLTRAAYLGYRSIENEDSGATLQEYLGYGKGFYKDFGGQLVYPFADYVHLAACTADQKAIDSEAGGYFTKGLVDLLRKEGRTSYRQIAGRLSDAMTVSHYRQTPLALCREDWKLDRKFLGEGLAPLKRSYQLVYNRERSRWQLNAGSIHGLVPSGEFGRSIVRVDGTRIEIELATVELIRSLVVGDDLKLLDVGNDSYAVTLVELAAEPMTMDISRLDKDMKRELIQAYDKKRCLYLNIIDDSRFFSFQAIEKEKEFSLEGYPFLPSKKNAEEFLDDIESVARWTYFKSLDGKPSYFKAEDFEFTVERIEGQPISNSKSLDWVRGKITTISPNTSIYLNYVNNHQPAFRFSIRMCKNLNQEECYVAALYFGSEFGIYDNFLTNVRLSAENPRAHLNYHKTENSLIHAIPLKVHPTFSKKEIECVDEYLKIIVADRPIDLSTISQPDLPLDKSEAMRAGKDRISSKETKESKPIIFLESFAIFHFPIRLCRREQEKV
ncbi:caspase family protein [Algoriphagus aestuariicola]|uniref:Caspase family protein n=1 Tax=Algoriphagus aestuariicola TaxID=1852016 RepID=A0ABS3BPI2_9BACT|nr:caspase family protein [Algoriphagus aestuariicola]MBN7801176.1 caspase family protein [Algoriphagus aestuariicola]